MRISLAQVRLPKRDFENGYRYLGNYLFNNVSSIIVMIQCTETDRRVA